ncbi:MAG: gliding motility protein GldC [Deltaproteobacteria bacterium]
MNKNRITIDIELDENRLPEIIKWNSDINSGDFKISKAFFLSIFDKAEKDTLEIDLWTKDMQVIEMDRFVFQTINSLSDMYFRATKNSNLANTMKNFAYFFGEETKIISK